MQVELVYPKIPESSKKLHGKCHVFNKYDGTNLHWIWNNQNDWHLFGTRRTQFSFDEEGIAEFQSNHPQIGNAPNIFNQTLRNKLTVFLREHKTFSSHSIILFTEFHGPDSFAGDHKIGDNHELTIIDVMVNGRLLEPTVFHEIFQQFGSAQLIFQGKYSGQLAEDIRKGKYSLNEGAVVKSVVDSGVFMTKIKTINYLERLEKYRQI